MFVNYGKVLVGRKVSRYVEIYVSNKFEKYKHRMNQIRSGLNNGFKV